MAEMTETTVQEKTLGDQMWDLLERKPENYDVTFNVGPNKTEVKAVKFILKAASPVFQAEFEENWEHSVMQNGSGIPLPDFDPIAFALFIKLLILDTWSVDVLIAPNVTPVTLLSLLIICRRYKITKAIKNLEEAVDSFMQSFCDYKDTDEFLKMSQCHLATLFACNSIPLKDKDIIECAWRWGEHQCSLQNLEATGENIRRVLGRALLEIWFPSLSNMEFSAVCRFKSDLLTADEKLAVYNFIGMTAKEKNALDAKEIPFKTELRSPLAFPYGCSVLSLPKEFEIVDSPGFACSGDLKCNYLKTSDKIALSGVGFLGPIQGDSHYDVTVEIKRLNNGLCTYTSGKLDKKIFAKKGETFYVLFDQPIAIEPIKDTSWTDHYKIFFTLQGSDIPKYKCDTRQTSLDMAGIKFDLKFWNNSKPLATLLWKQHFPLLPFL